MCLRKWSLDVCLIWTSSATEHSVQKSVSNPDKATAASLSRSPKGLKRIKHQRLISREMFSAHGLPISSNSLFHRSFAALFLATQNSLATSWVWRSHEGKGCGGWALFTHAVVLYFWTAGCFVVFFFYSWQFLPCDNRKKRPSQYHREVLNLSFIHSHHQGCEQDSLKSRLPCLPLCVLLMHSRLSLGFSIWSPPKLLLPWNIPDPLSPSPASSICSQSA